jgi:hypothetical protein
VQRRWSSEVLTYTARFTRGVAGLPVVGDQTPALDARAHERAVVEVELIVVVALFGADHRGQ